MHVWSLLLLPIFPLLRISNDLIWLEVTLLEFDYTCMQLTTYMLRILILIFFPYTFMRYVRTSYKRAWNHNVHYWSRPRVNMNLAFNLLVFFFLSWTVTGKGICSKIACVNCSVYIYLCLYHARSEFIRVLIIPPDATSQQLLKKAKIYINDKRRDINNISL